MSWLNKIGRIISAQINHLIQETEDPEKILEQIVMEMEQELIEMRRALAEAVATAKSTERQIANHQAAAQKWYERAQIALDKGHEPLAREALIHRQAYQTNGQNLQAQLDKHSNIIIRVKQELRILERKYNEAKAKKNLYIARLRSATASQKLQELVGNFEQGNAAIAFEKIEAKILELEAQTEILGTLQTDTLEEKFSALEGNNPIDQELEKLKAKKSNPPLDS